MKACIEGKKHKWAWVRNKTVTTATIHTRSISLKGVYRCTQCAECKYGAPAIHAETAKEKV